MSFSLVFPQVLTIMSHVSSPNLYGTAQRQLDTHGLSTRVSVDFYMRPHVRMQEGTPVKRYCDG